MTTKLNPESALERNVARWANARAKDYDNGLEGVFKDLFYAGCASGMVGHLIYYKDTLAFYRKHRREIETMLKEICDDCGSTPAELFDRAGWDKEDYFARENNNQNILAWFGFEEAASRLCNRAEIEA